MLHQRIMNASFRYAHKTRLVMWRRHQGCRQLSFTLRGKGRFIQGAVGTNFPCVCDNYFFFFRNHGLLFQTLEAPLIVSNLSILSLATRQYQQSDLEICERPWPYQICFAFRVLHFYEILRFSLLSCPVSLDYTECVHCTVGGPLVAHVLFNLGDFKEKNQGKIIGKVCLFRLSVISIATRVVTSHCMGSCTNKISARLRTCQILAVFSSN